MALHHFATATLIHPILVNFTAALIPVSVGSDLLAWYRKDESLRSTGWWTLFYGTLITPLTAITGWLFWAKDDNGTMGMEVHKWLGTGLAVLLVGLLWWRWRLHREKRWVSVGYASVAIVFAVLLMVQGHLGGVKVFSS